MRLTGFVLGAALAVFSAALLAQPAEARDRGHRHGHGHHHHHHGYKHHRGVDVDIWVGGHWRHSWYGGRHGWWWVAGPGWYYYDRPTYPYPPYDRVVVVREPTPPAGAPPAQYWYYCDNPKGYYPYVASCATAWRAVPVTPPGPTQ